MDTDQADRTLFVGNLHPKVTEELLFELFLQAGPTFNVKIPKDKDGKAKLFAFVTFKHEVSVPYAINLLNGIKLFGRAINLQFRTGSTHVSQDANTAAQSPQGNASTAGSSQASNGSSYPRQDINEDFMKYSDLSPVPSYQGSYSTPDNLQRQAVMNNFYKQESSHGSRAPIMGQQPSPPSSSYISSNSWKYSSSSNHPTPHRYESSSGHRPSRNHAKNESYYSREMYNREVPEEHHYRGHGSEEHLYRSRGQERLSPNPRNDPRWGPPYH